MEGSIVQKENINTKAKNQNSIELWDELWEKEGNETWRAKALEHIYKRIIGLIKQKANKVIENKDSNWEWVKYFITDIGGGVGILAKMVMSECSLGDKSAMVIDHSNVALSLASQKNISTMHLDLENIKSHEYIPISPIYTSTEFVEHLSSKARNNLFKIISKNCFGTFISVPNNRLGPDEEPQHTIKFTAISFKKELLKYFKYVRVEVLGPYLLGICGDIAKKNFTLSATLPVRDESADLEITLSSLRGIADQLVIGIDPRTKDNTLEISELYCDKIFYLKNPMGPPDGHEIENCPICKGDCKEYINKKDGNGINFSWVRNQCIKQCDGEWIFMTEGHERLAFGQDILLNIDSIIPSKARIGLVARRGQGQQWGFPWLFKNDLKSIKFVRPVHNALDYPEGTFVVALPRVITIHDRNHKRASERAVQRKAQNRNSLMDDWLSKNSENSLFYLGQEWREIDPDKCIDRLTQFLSIANSGPQRYQARLILAKEYMKKNDAKNALNILHGCTADDWTRIDHFIWIGDIFFIKGEYEKSYKFYRYASVSIGFPPFTVWWIDLSYYSYLTPQRLAQVCGILGKLQESLMWAELAYNLLTDDLPKEIFDECKQYIELLKEKLSVKGEKQDVEQSNDK